MMHVLAGGAMPHPIGVAVPLALSIAVCIGLAGCRLRGVRLALSVVVSQFLFHALFGLGSGAGTVAAHHGGVNLPEVDGVATTPSLIMWAAHVVAAAATAAVLARGEAVLGEMSRAARRLATRLMSGAERVAGPQVLVRTRCSANSSLPTMRSRPRSAARSLRGPPVVLAA